MYLGLSLLLLNLLVSMRTYLEMTVSSSTLTVSQMGMDAQAGSACGTSQGTTSLDWWVAVVKWLGQWESYWEERSTITTPSSWWKKHTLEGPLYGIKTMGKWAREKVLLNVTMIVCLPIKGTGTTMAAFIPTWVQCSSPLINVTQKMAAWRWD